MDVVCSWVEGGVARSQAAVTVGTSGVHAGSYSTGLFGKPRLTEIQLLGHLTCLENSKTGHRATHAELLKEGREPKGSLLPTLVLPLDIEVEVDTCPKCSGKKCFQDQELQRPEEACDPSDHRED